MKLRQMPLKRLLATIAAVIVAGVLVTAVASGLSGGPTPPAKPLAQAVHDAMGGPRPTGVTASIQFTNRLLEGAGVVAGEGGESVTSSPLVAGGHGRLWISKAGQVRIELQSESGDTEIYWENGTLTVYDVASRTAYTYTPHAAGAKSGGQMDGDGAAPSVQQVEAALAKLEKHAEVSGAKPEDVAGRPAYTVSLAPREKGSLIGEAQLSFDAENGVPLRAAVYSTSSSQPVMELAAEGIAYESPEASVFEFKPPAGTKIVPLTGAGHGHGAAHRPAKVTSTVHGHGITAVAELQTPSKGGEGGLSQLPSVSLGATRARELKTALGTILTFEQGGVRYVFAGAVEPAAVEAAARER